MMIMTVLSTTIT